MMFLRMAVLAVLAGAGFAHPTLAADAKIAVSGVWARATPGNAPNGAAFMTFDNHGADDKLLAAEAKVAKSVELHTHIKDGEVMKMRQVMAIEVPAGKPVKMEPGGLHVMFLGLNAPLKEGESFPLTLVFEKAGKVDVTVPVKGAGAMSPGAMSSGAMSSGATPPMDHSAGHKTH
jgi:copper(I)-binding protein